MLHRLHAVALMAALVIASATAQLPQVHMIDFDRTGDSIVRDYGELPGVPTLHGSAVQLGTHPVQGQLHIASNTTGWCQTNRPLNVSGEWTIEFTLRDEVSGHDGSLEYFLGSFVPSGFRVFRGGVAQPGELRIRGLAQEIIVTGFSLSSFEKDVAIVQDAQEVRVYLDGVLEVTSQQQNTLTISDSRGLLIGANFGDNSFAGLIEDVYVWNEARTPTEIQLDQFYGHRTFQFYNPMFPAVTPRGDGFGNDVSNTQVTTEIGSLRNDWVQDENDAPTPSPHSDWFKRWGPTPTPGTGPDYDFSFGPGREGYYIYVEDDGEEPEVRLWSPVFDLFEVPQPYLSFWCHSNNGSPVGADAQLRIEIRELTPQGPVVHQLPLVIGHLGDDWTRIETGITAFGGGVIQLGLIVNTANGHALHDIALDDILIANGTSHGQPSDPQRALIVREPFGGYNDAYHHPYSGANGPYYTTIDGTDGLHIKVEGRPDQPVILAAGPLNATGPWPFGVINLGGAFDPMTGLIDGVVIVGDGTSQAFPDFLFRTDSDGVFIWGLGTLPPLPPGPLIAFQAVVLTGDSDFLAVSNALEISIE